MGYRRTESQTVQVASTGLAYTVKDLGTLGSPWSHPLDINEADQVVGYSPTTADFWPIRAFLYEGSGPMQDLGTLGGEQSWAFGINDAGTVVGTADAEGRELAFLYEDGQMKDLNDLVAPEYSADWHLVNARAINNKHQVVGEGYYRPTGDYHVFLFEDGRVRDLGTLGTYTYANDINELAQVAGYLIPDVGYARAFLYEGSGPMQDLGTLGGHESRAYSLNDKGQVVGESQAASGEWRAFLYENGQMKDLNSLISEDSGWTLERAWAINENSQIVGSGSSGDFFLYGGGQVSDIESRIVAQGSEWYISVLYGINNKGQVIVSAGDLNNLQQEGAHAVVLDPTEIPSDMNPTVISVRPANEATGVSPRANVVATFSEAMRAATINKSTFLLYKKGTTTPIGATVNYIPTTKKAALIPNHDLRLGTTYKAVVTAGARDLAGNPLDQNPGVAGMQRKVWYFTIRK